MSLDKTVHLIAKEFPIPTFSKTEESRNAKVDYLCYADDDNGNDKILYLVELKTTSSSVDDMQMLKYFCIAHEMENKENVFEEIEKVYKGLAEIWKNNIESNAKIRSYIEKAQMFAGSRYPLWDWSVSNMYRIFYNKLCSTDAIKEILSEDEENKQLFIDKITDSQKYFTLFVRLLSQQKDHFMDIDSLKETLKNILCNNSKQRYTLDAGKFLNDWLNKEEELQKIGNYAKNGVERSIYEKVLREKEIYKEMLKVRQWIKKHGFFNQSEAILSYPYSNIHFKEENAMGSRIFGKKISKIQIVYLAPVLDSENLEQEIKFAEQLCVQSKKNTPELFRLITYKEIKNKCVNRKKSAQFQGVLDILDYIYSYNLKNLYHDIRAR